MDTWNAESDANRISTLIPLRGRISDESGHIHTSYSYSWHAVVAWSMRVQVRKSHLQCTRGVIRSTSAMGTWDVDRTCLDAQRFYYQSLPFLLSEVEKQNLQCQTYLSDVFSFTLPSHPITFSSCDYYATLFAMCESVAHDHCLSARQYALCFSAPYWQGSVRCTA